MPIFTNVSRLETIG